MKIRILDRYIAQTVIGGSLVALLVLVSLAAFFSFLGQMDDLKGDYQIVQAIQYVFLTLPSTAYEMFPSSVLLGSLISLGGLAANSELIVIRASGVTIKRLAWAILKSGFWLICIAVFLGEVVAPPSEQLGQALRSASRTGYITLQSGFGFWARDGNSFVQIQRVLPGAHLQFISIYSYDDERKLKSVTFANSAQYQGNRWLLQDIKKTDVAPDRIRSQHIQKMEWKSLLNPDMLDVLTVDPQNLSAFALLKYINYLKSNNLDSNAYQLAFWVKVVTPLASLVMLLVAIPFVFGALRSTSAGQRILVGVLVGIGFHLLNQGVNHTGIVYGFSPFVSATLPSILFAITGLYALKRIK